MDTGDKIGIAIVTLGVFVDAFGVIFPGRAAKIKMAKRKAVFAVGTALVVVGLFVIFLIPGGPKAQGTAVTATVRQTGTATGNGSVGINNGTINNNYVPPKEQSPIQHIPSHKTAHVTRMAQTNTSTVTGNGNFTVTGNGNKIELENSQTPHPHPPDEVLPGFAYQEVVRLQSGQTTDRQYQYEISSPEGAKASFYLTKDGDWAFAVTGTSGEPHMLEIPLGADGIPFDQWVAVLCEAGSASGYSYLRVLVNGKEVKRLDLEFPIPFGSRRWTNVHIGSDQSGQNGGAFMFTGAAVMATTVADTTAKNLADNALQHFGIGQQK